MENFKLDGFKKYIRKGRSTKPQVAVRKNGCIAFNSGAIGKYDLDVFKYAMLYISDDRKRVAVQFTNSEKKEGILDIQARKGNFQLSARSFLKLYDFDFSETKNYDFVWNDSGKTAIFRPDIRKDAHERRTGIKKYDEQSGTGT